MNLGLMLLPVIAGYLFLTQLHYTRYAIQRMSGYHPFFQSAIAGSILFSSVSAIDIFLFDISPGDHFSTEWMTATAAWSVVWGFILPYPVNWFYGQEKAERRMAVEPHGRETMAEKKFGGKPKIHVTSGGRVYVDAEELLRSDEAQRVMKGMAGIPVKRTSSDKSSDTDHDTKG